MNRVKRQPLLISEIGDAKDTEALARLLKENFQRLQDYLSTETIQNAQWRLIEFTVKEDNPHFRFKHNLGFTPLDLIQTSQKGLGSAVYNFALFDSEYIDLAVTGTTTDDPLVLRCIIGRLS